MNWGVNEWVAAISAVLALASLVLNWVVVRRQTALQFETLKTEMDSDVLAWAHEAIDIVSQGAYLARGRGTIYNVDEFKRLGFDVCQKLSSVADRGRLFFPNEAPDTHGQDKEGAFQGFRPPVLDALVFASAQIERLAPEGGPDEDAARLLIKCRRLLVSEAQNAIDPRRRGQMLRQLSIGRTDDKKSSFRIAAELGETLEARYPGFLIDRRDEKWIAAREAMLRRGKL